MDAALKGFVDDVIFIRLYSYWAQLYDLDYADDLALLSYTQQQMQEKMSTFADTSARLGLNIYRGKSKILGST